MITTRIQLDNKGCIRSVEAKGHAGGFLKGENIACAGVSALIRTAARILEKEEDIQLNGDAPRPGDLYFSLTGYPLRKIERIRGITDFLCLGLCDLHKDFPEDIEVRIERDKEFIHGT